VILMAQLAEPFIQHGRADARRLIQERWEER
jgi:hypothetical protein